MKIKKISSNRSFGIVFFVIFFVLAFWSFSGSFDEIKLLPLCIATIFLVLGLINSNLLTPLNIIWIKFGNLLGKIVAPIVMGAIYFVIITPLGLILRLFKKDLLQMHFSKKNSYWIKREKNVGSMKRQF